MSTREWIIKNFRKNKAVIIFVADINGRLTEHWAIPSSDQVVRLEGVEKAIVLSNKAKLNSTKGNIPTYIVKYDNAEPIDLFELNKGEYGTEEFRLVIDNDMAEKVYKASRKNTISSESKLIMAVIVIGLLMLGYFLNSKIVDLETKIVIPDPPIVEEV